MDCLVQATQEHVSWIEEMLAMGVNTSLREGAIRCIATDKGKPIGLVDFWEDDAVIEPHIDWHPKSTVRDRYKVFLAGMKDFASFKNVMLKVADSENPFFEMWAKRGVLRKVGTLEDIEIPNVNKIHIYQLRRNAFVKSI